MDDVKAPHSPSLRLDAAPRPVLEIADLIVEFAGDEGRTCAVNGVSLKVPAGSTVALVGESGSGKTVISQAILGILPQKGRIAGGRIVFTDPRDGVSLDLAAKDPRGPKMRAIRGDRISIIFQEPMTALSPLHTIGDQLGEVVRLHRGASRAEARALSAEMLGLVRFPDPKRALSAYPFELSGGLRQRAVIAMALMCRPALLIADEPTTALDVTIQAEVLNLICKVQAELDMAVLLITHDFGVVANIADYVAVIYRGRIMETGTSETIFRAPAHPYLRSLLRAVPRFDMGPEERLQPIRPIEAQPAAFLQRPSRQIEVHDGSEALLELRKLSKVYRLRKMGDVLTRTVRAVDRLDLTVKCGECLGLVGQSGSGKTTTAKLVLGAETPDEGHVLYRLGGEMRDLAHLSKEERFAFRRKVQIIFQDPFSSLSPRMTVREILTEPLVIHGIGTTAERYERVKELVRMVGLSVSHLRRYPHSFSGGQRQRIGIARALALSPEFLLCDEPVSALDVSVQAQILNLLKDLKTELGLTFLFVSHNLAVVDYIADRVAVMCAGRVVEVADKKAIVEDARHPYTQALLKAIPTPSLDQKLDFSALVESGASEPSYWPEPYRLLPDMEPRLREVAPGHLVCLPELRDKAA
ncbi:peptide/nickel transport system ATP-binding protein [Rhodopseudomonas julia]|uniref:Peptide/nickel transport system ATP-binding protein n=1 Tax=Rhodopseudomonas julia TaxID=200617 RepID=A0ABU0C2A2_9BRAD|nr:ABC transporter ATP-binding protein [Rhodopseudomonas julia]MDQ0324642.1 peptide/nickel transport system ATP-binding protein [Rhodopseudomonas julia]